MFSGRRLTRFSRGAVRALLLGAGALTGVACASGAARDAQGDSAAAVAPIVVTDDAGHTLRLAGPARRIIPLVPSATEILIAIGATQQIVGRTRYDVAPEVASLPSVGGGVDPSVEAIVDLHPDLVISWGSDERPDVRDQLARMRIPIFILRTQDTTDIFRGIAAVGRLAGHDAAATRVADSTRAVLDEVRRAVAGRPEPRVLYVVYNDPPMTAGPRTFIGQLISLAGGRSIFADATTTWPNVSMEEILRRDPDLLIVPVGEGRTRSAVIERYRALPGWRTLRAVRTGHVVTVSADLMNRPSPSIAEAARVLARAFHPDTAGADTALHARGGSRP